MVHLFELLHFCPLFRSPKICFYPSIYLQGSCRNIETYIVCLCALFSLTRAANTGSYLDQLEAPQEVNEAKLKCLQEWTEKRLDSVVITVPGKDRNFYRLHCEAHPSLLQSPVFIPITDESQLIKLEHCEPSDGSKVTFFNQSSPGNS